MGSFDRGRGKIVDNYVIIHAQQLSYINSSRWLLGYKKMFR